jgi:hypothetical protein
MHSYHAYGLGICSELALPELTVSENSPDKNSPDVEIRLADADQVPAQAVRNRPYLTIASNQALLSVEEAGTFIIRGGREILVIPEAGVDERLLRRYLCGTVMGILLDQMGLLVLHASAVTIEGKACAFVGNQGSGKSSIATVLCGRGHRFVCDDVAAVRLMPGQAWIYPAFPQMKVSLETAAAASLPREALIELDRFEDKRGYRLPGDFGTKPVPLNEVFVIAPSEEPSAQPPLSPQDVVRELLRHTFPTRLGQAGDGRHLLKCAGLSRQVPLYRLPRARSVAELPEFARAVEHYVRELRKPAEAPVGSARGTTSVVEA